VRGSHWGVRRLARYIGLVSLLGVCVVAAQASTAPAPTRFRLTIVGTAHQEWAHTAAPVDEGACSRTEMTEGIRTATFRTREPVLVRLLEGRVIPVDVRGITGTVTLGGANTSDKVCSGVGTGQTSDCAQSKRSFAGAHMRLTSPRPGVVTLGPITGVRLAVADCPLEPVDVRRSPLGPAAGLLRLPKEALTEQRLARITLGASRTLKKVYALPEKGHLNARVEWRLTFLRARSRTR
jgi:hypothetical protein